VAISAAFRRAKRLQKSNPRVIAEISIAFRRAKRLQQSTQHP
jgi:hypothetical protein